MISSASSVHLRVRRCCLNGFSLVEILTVLAIVSILTTIVIISLTGSKGARDLTKAAYDVQGTLELARTTAMARDTYVWVGFFEEDPATPGSAGNGQVVISMVGSNDGTKIYNSSTPLSVAQASSLTQLIKLLKIPNLHLDVLSAAAVTRPSVPGTTYQVGSSSFVNGLNLFPYPLSGTVTYKFTHIIQFSPQGDATRIADVPTQVMEIGLRPAYGNMIAAASSNLAAIQVDGIGGAVTTYRP